MAMISTQNSALELQVHFLWNPVTAWPTQHYINKRIRGPIAPMKLGLKEQAVCAPLLVSHIIFRGAPRHTT
jgi:hypothetical protein